MKNLKCLLMAALAVVLFASCGKSYTRVVPADSKMVATVDFKSIVEKSELTSYPSIMKAIEQFINDNSRNKKEAEQAKKILEDPSASGIDFTEPMYVFMTGDRNFIGLALSVKDDGDLENFLKNQAGMKLKKEDGLMRCSEESAEIAFDGNSLVVLYDLGFGLSNVKADKRIVQLFDNDEDFTSTDAYSKMEDAEGDAKVWVNFGIVPSILTEKMGFDISQILGGMKLSDMNLMYNLIFDKGCVRIGCEFFGSTKEAQKKLEDNVSYLQKVKGDYLSLADNNCIAWGSSALMGDKLLEKLKNFEIVKVMLLMMEQEMDFDFSSMIRSLQGDVSFAFNCDSLKQLSEDNFLNHLVVAGKVNDSKYMKDFPNLFKDENGSTSCEAYKGDIYKLTSTEETLYWGDYFGGGEDEDVVETLVTKESYFYFGVDANKNLVFTTGTQTPDKLFKGRCVRLEAYKDEIQSSNAFFFLDLNAILSQMVRGTSEYRNMPPEAQSAIDLLDVVIARNEEPLKGEGRLVIKDNSKNILSVYLSLVDAFIKKNM